MHPKQYQIVRVPMFILVLQPKVNITGPLPKNYKDACTRLLERMKRRKKVNGDTEKGEGWVDKVVGWWFMKSLVSDWGTPFFLGGSSTGKERCPQ